MTRTIPKRPLLEAIVAALDQDKPELSLEYTSGLDRAERSSLQSMDVLSDGRHHETIWVQTANGPAEAAVFTNPITQEIVLYHPENGPTLITSDAVRRSMINADRFAAWTMHVLFRMPATKKPITMMPECVWDLGTPRLGKKSGVKVLLARRLHDPSVREAIGRELGLMPASKHVIVLTTTTDIAPDLRIPRVTVIVPFAEVMIGQAAGIDVERLGRFVEQGSTGAFRTRKPVDCADDGSWLRIYDREYTFGGGKKAIIRMLFEAWESGDEWVPVSRLLKDYGPGSSLLDVFKDKRPDHKNKWREYMEIRGKRARLIVLAQ